MKVTTIKNLGAQSVPTVLTIGNFDGVHLGHRELVKKVLSRSKVRQALPTVLTFEPHPVQVLFPEKSFKRLMPLDDKIQVLESLGVELLVVEPFSRELSSLAPEKFISELLLGSLKACEVIVGHDFSFGKNRVGNPEFLKKALAGFQIPCEVVEVVRCEGEIVSSSAVRKLVEQGSVAQAQRFLDRPFYLSGLVEKGAGRGRRLGFPTANVFTLSQIFPRPGVYVTRTRVGEEIFGSVTNVGSNPTFANGTKHPIQVETHILDFERDIYGLDVKVEFLEFIRDEKKFSSVEQLIAQIREDSLRAKGFHEENN